MYVGSRDFLNALLHYPSPQPPRPTMFGPYELEVGVNAPLAAGRFPLVVISHGSGGSPLLYRSLSLLLARNGFIVALARHAGNVLGDNHLATSVENLRNRPRQLVALHDALQGDDGWQSAIAEEPITAVVHSLGGYTVRSVAGAQPWSRSREPIEVDHDARLGALVLLAPACGFFLAPRALEAVTAPILVLSAEHDSLTPDPEIRAALAGVRDPARVTIQTVPNAGHFSFLSPFPRPMQRAGFAPAADPSGFDRERFHEWFPGLILEWIRERGRERGVVLAGG